MTLLRHLARLAPAAAAAAFAAAVLAAPVPARAQSIVAVVNGMPITSIDLKERRAFIRISQHKSETARQVTDELIDEALISQEAKRYGVTVPDSDVEARFAEVAKSVKLNPDQLGKALAQRGASARTFKHSIRAQLLYRTLLTRRFDPANAVSESAIQKQLAGTKDADKVYRYTLRQIIFVVGKKPSPREIARRRSEALALRNRFVDCKSGPALAEGLHDVAVKAPVVRDSSQFSKEQKAALERTAIGHLTEPQTMALGLQMIAVCERHEMAGAEARRGEILNELADVKFKQEAKEHIADLRRTAVIQYR